MGLDREKSIKSLLGVKGLITDFNPSLNYALLGMLAGILSSNEQVEAKKPSVCTTDTLIHSGLSPPVAITLPVVNNKKSERSSLLPVSINSYNMLTAS